MTAVPAWVPFAPFAGLALYIIVRIGFDCFEHVRKRCPQVMKAAGLGRKETSCVGTATGAKLHP
jgi:hypothetical protein